MRADGRIFRWEFRSFLAGEQSQIVKLDQYMYVQDVYRQLWVSKVFDLISLLQFLSEVELHLRFGHLFIRAFSGCVGFLGLFPYRWRQTHCGSGGYV